MGMRGKKKRQYTQEQKRLIKQFSKWCNEEIEKDFINQIRNYDPVPDMLNGVGVSNNLKGIYS